jgi:hypothetical protein
MTFLDPTLLRKVVANLKPQRDEKQRKRKEYNEEQKKHRKSKKITIKISVLGKLPGSSICKLLYNLKKEKQDFILV